MGTHRAAQQVVGGLHVGDPVSDGLVDGVLEGAGAALHLDHLCPQEPHAVDVWGLASHVLLAHVDDALQAQHGAHGGRRDAVLARAGLRDDALLAHVPGQEPLAQGVVDLVRAGVGQVLPFQVELRSTQMAAQVARMVEGRGPPGVVLEQRCQLLLEPGVPLHRAVRLFQLLQGRHQRLRDELAAVIAEPASLVGECLYVTHGLLAPPERSE